MTQKENNQHQAVQSALGSENTQSQPRLAEQLSNEVNADPNLVQTQTNYSLQTNRSEGSEIMSKSQQSQNMENVANLFGVKTAQVPIDLEKQAKELPIKKQQASVQAGGEKKVDIFKNTEETYAPQSCQVHGSEPTGDKPQNGSLPNNDGQPSKISEVEIQVGVSMLDEPQKIVNKAKQQRILSDQDNFTNFIQSVKLVSQNQKAVLVHTYESIDKRKQNILTWHDLLKHHFVQYASFTKDFYEKCEKSAKQEKSEQVNVYLNIGEQLKDAYQQLLKFKEASGKNHKTIYEYINSKTLIDLQKAYNKYGDQMSKAQSLVKEKKKAFGKIEEQFKDQGSKVQKMFSRAKEGKKQEDDYFAEIAATIVLERNLRQALVQWGKQVIQLRSGLIQATNSYANDIQMICNDFKSQSNILYGIQKQKYDKKRSATKQIEEDVSFSNLIILMDSDYIKSSLEGALKKQITEIDTKTFTTFVELPHAKLMIKDPRQMLDGLIVKRFALKDSTQQLVNTVSGNLVMYNRQSLECSEKMNVKQIKGATTVDQGAIEIEQKVPGIIFNSKKKLTIQFKDPDRAEELLCFLSQGQASK